MHELSVAHALITSVQESLTDSHAPVREVHLTVGMLSGVVPEALTFAYEVAAADTALADSVLVIHRSPIVIFCPTCATTCALPDATAFFCVNCGTPSGDVRSGKELTITHLVLDDEPALAGERG